MVFLHKSRVSTELGIAFSFPGLYKSMNRFFIANKLSLANHSMNLVSIPKSPRVWIESAAQSFLRYICACTVLLPRALFNSILKLWSGRIVYVVFLIIYPFVSTISITHVERHLNQPSVRSNKFSQFDFRILKSNKNPVCQEWARVVTVVDDLSCLF